VHYNSGFQRISFVNFAPDGWSSNQTATGASVTGITTSAIGLQVTHNYTFAADNILAIDGVVTNLLPTQANVTYRRGIYWTIVGLGFGTDSAFAPAIPAGSQVSDSTIGAVSSATTPLAGR
jgi:hypothetical protein